MDHFELHSEYQPTGDQPQAIKQLVEGFKKGNQFETLLGVDQISEAVETIKHNPDSRRIIVSEWQMLLHK